MEYARIRGVTVVPEIEMPGHSSAALASYPDLGCTGRAIPVPIQWGVFADIYCAGNERTFEFITSVLDDVLALFPSPYIHIGGDEVPKERWKECAACQDVMRREGLATESELQGWFVRRIGDYLAKRGRKLIGWDEVLQGGLFPGATVQAWEDTSFTRSAVESGHDVIASPGGWTYFNRSARELTLDQVYRFDPVPASLDAVAARRVLGGEATLWSEHITSPANLELMAFPRLLALAEVLWTDKTRDSAAFHARLDGDQLARLRVTGVAVGPADEDVASIRVQYDPAAHAPRVRIGYGAAGVTVRGTNDGSAPFANSPQVADSTRLTGEGVRRFQAYFGNVPVLAERRLTLVRSKALGKPVTMAAPPSPQYQGTGPFNLTDGISGSADHTDGLWQGWWGPDMDAVIDLLAEESVDTIKVTFLAERPLVDRLPVERGIRGVRRRDDVATRGDDREPGAGGPGRRDPPRLRGRHEPAHARALRQGRRAQCRPAASVASGRREAVVAVCRRDRGAVTFRGDPPNLFHDVHELLARRMRRAESAEHARERDGEFARFPGLHVEQAEVVSHGVTVGDANHRVTADGAHVDGFRKGRLGEHAAHERVPAGFDVDLQRRAIGDEPHRGRDDREDAPDLQLTAHGWQRSCGRRARR